MKWFTANSIFDTIRPVYRAGKTIGIFTHTIDFQKHELIKTPIDQLMLVLAVMTDVYALKTSSKNSFAISDSILLNVGIYSSVSLGFIISLAIMLYNRLVARRMFGIFTALEQVDVLLLSHGYRMNHQFNHLVSCCFMATPLIVNFVMMIITFFIDQDPVSESLTLPEILVFLRSSLVFTIFGSYTCVSLCSIYLRFRGLNEVISDHFPTSLMAEPIQKAIGKEASAVVSSVRSFGDIHEKLCDTIVDFNYCFALQILLMMASAFGYTLFSIFGLIHTLSQAQDEQRTSMNNMVYGCIFLSFIIQVVVTGSLATQECKKTGVVIHKAICYGIYDEHIRKQFKFLSQQLRGTSPTVSCLLFDFEWPFLVAVAASLVMHVVILVQFDLANIAKKV
uniref:Gustatory receptor n=1 Tax=Anopheles dirus TaxID=7168 RepID=A0A182NR15_9DIPT